MTARCFVADVDVVVVVVVAAVVDAVVVVVVKINDKLIFLAPFTLIFGASRKHFH